MNPNQNSQQNMILSAISYIGILVIVSYLMAKEVPSVKFHIKQGLVLLVIEVAVGVVGSFLWHFWPLLNLINLATLVLSIIGIINVVQHKEKELPVVGQYAKNFKF